MRFICKWLSSKRLYQYKNTNFYCLNQLFIVFYPFSRQNTTLKQKIDSIYSKTLCLPQTQFPLWPPKDATLENLQISTQDVYNWQVCCN